MANNQQQDKDKRPRAAYDMQVLTLWGTKGRPEWKTPSFSFNVTRDGNASLTCRTGNPEDKDKTKQGDGDVIRMRMNPKEYKNFINLYGDVVRSKGPLRHQITEQVHFGFNKDTKQREKLAQPRDGVKFSFGKDEDGVIRFALTQYNRTELEFSLAPDRSRMNFSIRHPSGEEFTDGDYSQLEARGYLDAFKEAHQMVLLSDITMHQRPDAYQPPYVPNGNGGVQRNSGNGGGGGGNWNRPAPAAAAPAASGGGGFTDAYGGDDDVPY
jgi:hypothetical protein